MANETAPDAASEQSAETPEATIEIRTEDDARAFLEKIVGKKRAQLIRGPMLKRILDAFDKSAGDKKAAESDSLDMVSNVLQNLGLSDAVAGADTSSANAVFDALNGKNLRQAAANIPALSKILRPEPIRNTRESVSRNDPCTCGSGKKFKKCCGRKK